MKYMRTTRVFGAALAVITLSVVNVSTQGPTITSQQSGNAVQIAWTPVPGAAMYEIFVSGVPNPFTTTVNSVTISPAPPGTYVLQVRGRNGAQEGPLSAPTTVVITGSAGPGPCLPLSPPTIGSSVTGNVVTINWGAVPGALGYRLQVGNAPGVTLYSQDFGASQSSFTSPVPATGTFYARVIAGNACGQAMASTPDHAFTIGSAVPGPPAPPPTTLPGPPFPSFVPNLEAQVNACRARYPAEFACAHTGQSCTRQFIVYCARDMNRLDPFVGLNWKRGAVGSLSEDIIAYRGVGTAVDIVNGGRMEIVDVIFGAGGPSPSVGWNPGPGGPGDRGAWVNPFTIQP